MGNLIPERATDLSRATQQGRPWAGDLRSSPYLPGLDKERPQERVGHGVVGPGGRGLGVSKGLEPRWEEGDGLGGGPP